ncbi:MAG: hypothetical protein ACFCVK_06680 [Acidimicrobiales bacterium]
MGLHPATDVDVDHPDERNDDDGDDGDDDDDQQLDEQLHRPHVEHLAVDHRLRPGGRMAARPPVGHTRRVQDESPLDIEQLLNPDEQRAFRRLCIETSAEDLAELVNVVDLHLDHIRHSGGAVVDRETAERIGSSLARLLSADNGYSPDDRALIRGAVEYFLLTEDASSDLDDPLGFDDDARVVNSVLVKLGRQDLAVELP